MIMMFAVLSFASVTGITHIVEMQPEAGDSFKPAACHTQAPKEKQGDHHQEAKRRSKRISPLDDESFVRGWAEQNISKRWRIMSNKATTLITFASVLNIIILQRILPRLLPLCVCASNQPSRSLQSTFILSHPLSMTSPTGQCLLSQPISSRKSADSNHKSYRSHVPLLGWALQSLLPNR